MKKIFSFAIAAAAVVALTGCTTTVNTSDSASLVQHPHLTTPGYEAQYSIKNTRVKGQATLSVLFGFISWGVNSFADNANLSGAGFLSSNLTRTSAVKSAAVYNACKAQKADALVGTRYTITTTTGLFYREVKCEVAGFPATIIGAKAKQPYVIPGERPQIVWSTEKPIIVK